MRFLADSMLGKLAKVLRMLGFDTVYAHAADPLTILVRARNESRILLTRNQKLNNRHGVFFIASEKIGEQLAALAGHFQLAQEVRFFSRCLICNTELERVSKHEVQKKVPFFTYRTQTEFSRCSNCGRVYWPGSHLKDMVSRLQPLLDVSRETPTGRKA